MLTICVAVQVHRTPGLLLEKPTPVETYVEQGWQMVANGFKPFFPSLASMSDLKVASLNEEFCAKAKLIGQGMLNMDCMVEDKHTNLWVSGNAGA